MITPASTTTPRYQALLERLSAAYEEALGYPPLLRFYADPEIGWHAQVGRIEGIGEFGPSPLSALLRLLHNWAPSVDLRKLLEEEARDYSFSIWFAQRAA